MALFTTYCGADIMKDKIISFVRNNLGEHLFDSPLLNWYISRLYDKGQIIVAEDNGEIKAIQCYFLCWEEDSPYIETLNWTLPLRYTEGDILYLALTVSVSFKYLKEIGERVRGLIKEKDITKVVAYDLPDKEVKIWRKIFGKWFYEQGNLSLLKQEEEKCLN